MGQHHFRFILFHQQWHSWQIRHAHDSGALPDCVRKFSASPVLYEELPRSRSGEDELRTSDPNRGEGENFPQSLSAQRVRG